MGFSIVRMQPILFISWDLFPGTLVLGGPRSVYERKQQSRLFHAQIRICFADESFFAGFRLASNGRAHVIESVNRL